VYVAAAQRRGCKDDAANFWPVSKEKFLPKIFPYLRRQWHVIRRATEDVHPKFVPAVGQQQAADTSSHAVADYNRWFHFGNRFSMPSSSWRKIAAEYGNG
jgi:hypothetical protein